MRRLTSLLAAAVVATSLAAMGPATAKDHHEDRREQGARGGEARGGPPRQGPPQGYRGEQEYRGGGRYERVEPRNDPRSDPRYSQRYDPRSDPRSDPRADPRGAYGIDPRYDPRGYDPRGYAPPGAYQAAPRRGGYLEQGGPVIEDYGRYRLRPPPRGYDWVRTPGGMALVQQGTGRVYDVVPY